jgi:hypothetical protein
MIMKKWIMSKIELHLGFEQIPLEKKNLVSTGLKTSIIMFNNYVQTNKTLEESIALQFDFINEIMSIPSINKYFFPLINGGTFKINFKNLYSSYYYSKKVDMDEKEKEEEKKEMMGDMVKEVSKSEKKMFIFSNTFELLHTKLVNEMNTFEVYPILQVLEQSA